MHIKLSKVVNPKVRHRHSLASHLGAPGRSALRAPLGTIFAVSRCLNARIDRWCTVNRTRTAGTQVPV